MSLRSILLSIPIFILSVTWTYACFKNLNKPRVYRAPVSISEFTGYGVIERSIKIKLTEQQKSKLDQDLVYINVSIELPYDFAGPLEYKWLVGENVSLKSGSLVGQLKNFKASQKQFLQVGVRGFSKIENRHVAFQIAGFKDGRKIFADGIIASLQEQTFENTVQNVEKLRAERSQD